MPTVVENNSRMYLEEHDCVFNFVTESIVKDPQSYFTLTRAKEVFKSSDHFNSKIATLRTDLQKH